MPNSMSPGNQGLGQPFGILYHILHKSYENEKRLLAQVKYAANSNKSCQSHYLANGANLNAVTLVFHFP